MAALRQRILKELKRSRTPLDDDQLAEKLGVARQAINQECRKLAKRKQVVRYRGPSGKLVNELSTRRTRKTAREADRNTQRERT